MKRLLLVFYLLLLPLPACVAPVPETAPDSPPERSPVEAPWQQARLAASEVPSVYSTEWQQAENRSSCSPLAPESLASAEAAVPRAAPFAGGWGVAYDLPDLRSAFGVAGTGVSASAPSYHQWPLQREWPDGSSVGYGPEGGTGPNQLAYLRIAGQGCLYNVWSRIGLEHLESLLSQLRFVDVSR